MKSTNYSEKSEKKKKKERGLHLTWLERQRYRFSMAKKLASEQDTWWDVG